MTGDRKQCYWTYAYPEDQGGGFEFDSKMIQAADLKPGDMLFGERSRCASRENCAHRSDRIDAVLGRMSETWFKAEREGLHYSGWSKLCGKDHCNLPIAFHGVSEESYPAWLAGTRKKCAATPRQAISRPMTLPP